MNLIQHADSPRFIRLHERDNVVVVVNDQGVPTGTLFSDGFMTLGLSLASLVLYAAAAAQAKGMLTRPAFSVWISRLVGSTFICFGAAILAMRRPIS